MNPFDKLIRILGLILCLIICQINVINCKQYVPMQRAYHTATFVGDKIYFLGGFTESLNYTNDFFTLDVSKSFNQSEGLPFEDLSYLSSSVPEHNRATTSVGGQLKDTIFLFDGHMGNYTNYASEVVQSFSTSEKIWQSVTINSGVEPLRRTSMNAATDNNGKVFLFGGAKELDPIQYYNIMNTFDTINKVWNSMSTFETPRDGYTATYIPESNIIIYIGGFGGFGKYNYPYSSPNLLDISNLDIYDTINNYWREQPTQNPPQSRVFHTAVLTNDSRIIVFGGADNTTSHPVNSHYEVLDVNTYQWYHGTDDVNIVAPFRGHTATLVGDYMFIAFGIVYTKDGNFPSNKIIIYKIGNYANFQEVDSFITQSIADTDNSNSKNTNTNIKFNTVQIIAIAVGTSGIVIIAIAVFIIYKKYPKKKENILFIE
ncbi:hypothetical protein RclHR1_01290015 [Rhizophagus clarus]|uniref:Galactose oxidase n=1 Tax=Rhizophagus clarus TaxID=94130 RepID=A0A2Z6QNZ7_9GLOM|nr:hypothetical protein RclHR1_01290015 [Rhizophagus clarus]GES75046.1 hypothetical protein GLOIN_2v1725607 [Rhizophagus clarus]